MNMLYTRLNVPTTATENAAKARSAVHRAVERCELLSVVDCVCEICGDEAHVYHHHDYAPGYWLDVIPLCTSCHKTLHLVGTDRLIETRLESVMRRLQISQKRISKVYSRSEELYLQNLQAQLKRLQSLADMPVNS